MDQKKTGLFLKELRKEKGLTQEQLSAQLNVSSRSVSRWETGTNLPDISLLVELADFYNVDIKEIIDGERKSEIMNENTRETLEKVAEYTKQDKKLEKQKMRRIIGCILIGFGAFLAISALAIFPRDSSWGSIYSVFGALIVSAGVFQLFGKIRNKILCSVACFVVMYALLVFTDFLGVLAGNQVPRFAYVKEWRDDSITYRATFYSVVWHQPDTENEYIEIIQ